MQYEHIRKGSFISRPNRFVAEIEIDGKVEICHVKNTGRCRELLRPGAEVYVQKALTPGRKTGYDLIVVRKGDLLVNMDSQIPNAAAAEWLLQGGLWDDISLIKREVKYGNSRFDLYIERENGTKIFMEVKGVTLENDGIASFPDAPTERGIKHIRELCKCREDGYEAYLLFVIQMKGIRQMRPNWERHEAFGEALCEAADQGVRILAYDCRVKPDEMVLDAPVPVWLVRD